jgi:hypothetical protein
MVLFQSYAFVWSIIPEVFCRWSSFHNFEGGPSTEHLWVNAPHKNITLKEDHLQNTSGLTLHTKNITLKKDHLQNTSGLMLHTKT